MGYNANNIIMEVIYFVVIKCLMLYSRKKKKTTNAISLVSQLFLLNETNFITLYNTRQGNMGQTTL